MLGIPVCNRLVYRLETQRRIEKRREEKKKEYTRKNLAVLFFWDCFSFCLPFLFSSSYDVLLLPFIKLWRAVVRSHGRKNKLTYAENKYIIESLRNTEKIDKEVANNLIGLDRAWLLPFFRCWEVIRMTDNTLKTSEGIEVYKNNINYFADEYIKNELGIDHVSLEDKQTIKDSFVDMLFYISDRINKPDNADIKALDYIFNVYVRLCSKYSVNPTLEAFSFLVDIDRTTFTNWLNGQYRTAEHLNTVKKWMNICKGFLVNNLGNSKGTDANKIFIAKAAYGMAETKAVEQERITGATKSIEQIAADIGADALELPDGGGADDFDIDIN